MRRRTAAAKPKKVSYELIARDSIIGHPMYALLDELVDLHHKHLRRARIALAWCTSWKPDVDGRVTLGMCRKASDLDREMVAFDFIILLSRGFWRDERVTAKQCRALLDHELCHAELKFGRNGEPMEDERGRLVFRLRKHDLEEFSAIAERYGTWKKDIETFAAALRRSPQPFKGCHGCRDLPGWVTVVCDDGVTRLSRCACYVEWMQQRADVVSA